MCSAPYVVLTVNYATCVGAVQQLMLCQPEVCDILKYTVLAMVMGLYDAGAGDGTIW